MSLFRDEGIVLRTHRLGEADRIVTLLTRSHGKVRAVAKGVRKTKSRFGARLDPTSHVQLLLYQGRELDIVTQVETVDHHPALRHDIDRLARAVVMLEAADQMSLERQANPALFQLLLGALRTLAERDAPLVVPAFFLKVLAAEGVGLQVDECMQCGSEGPLVAWDVGSGGLRCREHRQGVGLGAEAVEIVQDVLGGRLAAALARPLSPATVEVDRLATQALEHHLERHLRAVVVLSRV